MVFSDIVALAKAGYSPKDVKLLMEMCETSPKVQDAKAPTPEEANKALEQAKKDSKVEEKSATPEPQEVVDTNEDIFKKFFK